MRYAYAETTPSLNLAASLAAQIRGGWAEVGTTIAEHPAEHTHKPLVFFGFWSENRQKFDGGLGEVSVRSRSWLFGEVL